MAKTWQTLSRTRPIGFMIATQDQVISTNNYIVKDPNINNDICRICREKLENIQRIIGACLAVAKGDYTHRHNQVASIVHQEVSTKCGLSNGPPTAHVKIRATIRVTELQLCDRSIITDRTVPDNRPDIVIVDKTIKEAMQCNNSQQSQPSQHRHRETQKTDLNEEPIKIRRLKTISTISNIYNRYYPKEVTPKFAAAKSPPTLYTLMQKAALLNVCHIVRKPVPVAARSQA